MDETPSADQLIAHVEEVAHSVRRMRERMALLGAKGPVQLLEQLESDLLRVRDLPKER